MLLHRNTTPAAATTTAALLLLRLLIVLVSPGLELIPPPAGSSRCVFPRPFLKGAVGEAARDLPSIPGEFDASDLPSHAISRQAVAEGCLGIVAASCPLQHSAIISFPSAKPVAGPRTRRTAAISRFRRPVPTSRFGRCAPPTFPQSVIGLTSLK